MALGDGFTRRYVIRKVGRVWRLYRDGAWAAESSHWKTVAWVATGDPAYRPTRLLSMLGYS